MARKTTEEEVRQWVANKHLHVVLIRYTGYMFYHTFIKDSKYRGDILEEARQLYPDAISHTQTLTSIRTSI